MSDAMRNWFGDGFSADRALATGNSSTTRIAARESNRSFAGLSLVPCSWIGCGETIGTRSLGYPSHSLKTGRATAKTQTYFLMYRKTKIPFRRKNGQKGTSRVDGLRINRDRKSVV